MVVGNRRVVCVSTGAVVAGALAGTRGQTLAKMGDITFNTREFQAALKSYAEVSKRDWPEIVNRQALNLALRSMQFTPKAERAAIQANEGKDWWPKYIAKRIKGSGVVIKQRGRAFGTVIRERYTRAEARKVSRAIIQARVRASAFCRAGWIPAAKLLAQKLGRTIRVSAKQFGKAKGAATAATVGRATAEIINSARGAGKVGAAAFQAAINFVANDMREYTLKKMAERARQHSAR